MSEFDSEAFCADGSAENEAICALYSSGVELREQVDDLHEGLDIFFLIFNLHRLFHYEFGTGPEYIAWLLSIRVRRNCSYDCRRNCCRALQGMSYSCPKEMNNIKSSVLMVDLLRRCYSIFLTGFAYPIVVRSMWSSSGFLSASSSGGKGSGRANLLLAQFIAPGCCSDVALLHPPQLLWTLPIRPT